MSIQSPPSGQADTYRPLSWQALGGFALSVMAAAAVLVGGLLPVASANFGLFGASLVLTPLVFAGVAAVRGTRGTGLLLAAAVGLAAWASVLGVGGLLVLSRREPWVLPTWFWAVAAGGVVLSWVARGQIRGSENTLSGERLAQVGLLVGLGVMVVYGAYVSSSLLAVQSQARTCALDFLDQVKKGDIYQAFARTLPPNEPRDREHIENVYNVPGGTAEGSRLSMLTDGPLFRLIQMGGEQTRIEERGLKYDYSQGKYTVVLEYRGFTPYYTFDFQVGTEGVQSDTASGQRRVWNVLASLTSLMENRQPEPTARGLDLPTYVNEGGELVEQFRLALDENRFDDAFLLTRPKAEREGEERKKALSSPERQAFEAGKTIDMSDAWIKPEVRDAVRQAMLKWFDPKVKRKVETSEKLGVYGLIPATRLSPLFVETPNGWKLLFPMRLLIRDPLWAMPKYMADVDVVVEGGPSSDTRITVLKLIRATPPPADKGPRSPG